MTAIYALTILGGILAMFIFILGLFVFFLILEYGRENFVNKIDELRDNKP